MVSSTLMTFLGLLITSGSCLKSTLDSAAAETGNVMILPNQNVSTSTSLLEDLVDGKCKKYTAGLQDQVNELRAKVDRLEVNKNDQNLKNNDHSLAKEMKKRDTEGIPKALRGICSTSSSLCTHYHPDHPDASLKKGKYSPTVTAEMLQNDPNTNMAGIPTSCSDLHQLGHSFNGLYLIKKSLPNNKGTKIQTVYCNFQSPSNVPNAEEFVGTVDVKTKRVHFSVQRHSRFNRYAVIPFDVAPVNEGNAFNLASGIFTVPVSGIYYFHFSAIKSNTATFLDIFLQVNGKAISTAYTNQQGPSKITSAVFLSASLRLESGDRVNLFNNKNSNEIGDLFDSGNHHTSFIGWLVEEDLV